jgi:hypothetical protein
LLRIAQSVKRLAAGWTVRGSNPGGGARFSAPVQTDPEAHPAFYTMATGSFPGVKRPGRGVDHPPPSSAEVKERVELYLYTTSGPSWPVLGWTLPLPLTKLLKATVSLVMPLLSSLCVPAWKFSAPKSDVREILCLGRRLKFVEMIKFSKIHQDFLSKVSHHWPRHT